MSEYAREQRRHARRHASDTEDRGQAGHDLRNPELDDDVACCLAEIDEALDREQDEREQALAEFAKFDRSATNRELNTWQAKYAHLGLTYGRNCCGTPFYSDDKGAQE